MIYSNIYDYYDGYVRCKVKLDVSTYESGLLKLSVVDASNNDIIRELSMDLPSMFDNGANLFYINEHAPIDVGDWLEELGIAEDTGDWDILNDNEKIRIYCLNFSKLGEKEK